MQNGLNAPERVPSVARNDHEDAAPAIAIRLPEWDLAWRVAGITDDQGRAARMQYDAGAYSRVMTGQSPVTWGFVGRALWALEPYRATFSRLFTTGS
jgi:YD repeat-containing protein